MANNIKENKTALAVKKEITSIMSPLDLLSLILTQQAKFTSSSSISNCGTTSEKKTNPRCRMQLMQNGHFNGLSWFGYYASFLLQHMQLCYIYQNVCTYLYTQVYMQLSCFRPNMFPENFKKKLKRKYSLLHNLLFKKHSF